MEEEVFIPFVLKRKPVPEHPKPEVIKQLREKLTLRKFEVLEEQVQGLGNARVVVFSTNQEAALKLKCPFCFSEFTGQEFHGCFNYSLMPSCCPVCGYPDSLEQELEKSDKE